MLGETYPSGPPCRTPRVHLIVPLGSAFSFRGALAQGKVWLLFDHLLLVYSISENPDGKPVMRCISPLDLESCPAFFQELYTEGKRRVFLECEQKIYELLQTDGGQKMDEEEALVLLAMGFRSASLLKKSPQ